jgi:hypothetical protein
MLLTLLLFLLTLIFAVLLVLDRRQTRCLVEAEQRGMALLLDNLSITQRMQYRASGYFDVTGSDTGRRYRIFYGRYRNVRELGPKGRLERGKCFVPKGNLAAGDCMLAQKIALESRESAALKVALPF